MKRSLRNAFMPTNIPMQMVAKAAVDLDYVVIKDYFNWLSLSLSLEGLIHVLPVYVLPIDHYPT
jgi:hypothetical protein